MGILCKSITNLVKSIFRIWKGKILEGTKFTKKPAPKPKLFKYVTQFSPGYITAGFFFFSLFFLKASCISYPVSSEPDIF